MIKVILFALACCAFTEGKITFEDCSKGKGIGVIKQMLVYPDPPSLSKNITAAVDLELFEDIPDNAILKASIYKVTGIFGIPLPAPCIAGIGSCTAPYCKFLDVYRDQACPFFPSDTECACPIKANTFGRGQNITIVPPNLGPILKFVASGQFRVEGRLYEKDTKRELLCFNFKGKALP